MRGEFRLFPAASQVFTWYSPGKYLGFWWKFAFPHGIFLEKTWIYPGYFQVFPWVFPGGARGDKNPGFYQGKTSDSGSGGSTPGFPQGKIWGFPVFQVNRKTPGENRFAW